ncbi:MAG: helix-turn-helix domain containing protein [Nanoarchaeota archaeon]|nr:helix-turn-helix domain containing protein [Nanoarchaeota archaeon]
MPNENLKKLLIETSVDKLVILARQKRGITVSEAAKLLGTSERQIEEWTRILEEHNLLKLAFPIAGPPKIIPVAVSQAKFSRKLEEFKQRKAEIETLAEGYLGQTKETEKLMNLKFVPVEEELYERLKELEGSIKYLGALKGMEKKMDSDISEFEREKDSILKESGELEKKTSEITKKIDSVTATSQDMAADVAEALADMQKQGKGMKVLEGTQKKIEDEITALEKEMRIVSALADNARKKSFMGKLSGLFGRKKGKGKPRGAKKYRAKPPARKIDFAKPAAKKAKSGASVAGKKKKIKQEKRFQIKNFKNRKYVASVKRKQ